MNIHTEYERENAALKIHKKMELLTFKIKWNSSNCLVVWGKLGGKENCNPK